MSLDSFYRIQNHEDGYHHFDEKIRQYRYEIVDEDREDYEGEYHVYGVFRISGAPDYIHQGFYHVKDADLSEAWWKKPSYAEQLEILTRYPEATF